MRTFSFVAAASGSGKTTLIEKLIPLLKARGFRVAVIKHASKGFELDQPGKDSWRFQEAGADTVLLAGPRRMAVFKNIDKTPSLVELEEMNSDVDIILEEGFKREGKNKIEVFRSGVSGSRPLCFSDDSFLALVSDTPVSVSIPAFTLNDAESIASFLMSKL